METRTIKCAVACYNAAGTPDFFACVVEKTAEAIANGEHYDEARDRAGDARYDSTDRALVYDEDDGPAWLFENLFPKETDHAAGRG